MTKTYTFNHCWVHVSPEYTETVFQDGTRVTATPEETDEYRAKAERYGYGNDLPGLSREHEILHTFLAERLRDGCSHALWAVAHGQQGYVAPIWEQEQEEALVLAFQIYLNGGSADEEALQPIRDAGFDKDELRQEALALLRGESTGATQESEASQNGA